MLRASSLIYSITIVFLTGILASSFLLYQQLSQKETDLYLLQYRLSKNARSGIEYLLAASAYTEYYSFKEITLSENPADSVRLLLKPWGIFEIGVSKAHFKNKQSEMICLIGSKNSGNEKTGLYAVDLDREIAVCGKTILNGVTYLPNEGIKRAYIEGQNYTGDKLVYGIQRNSSREIPLLKKELTDAMLKKIKGEVHYTDSIVNWHELNNDTIIQSHYEKTIRIQHSGNIVLESGYYNGNIQFRASKKIEIKKGCRLEGVILFAPEIYIDNSDTSFFQAFATDTLVLMEKSVLIYPSVLAVIKDPSKKEAEPVLKVEKDARIAGSILVYEEQTNHKNYPMLKIEEGATVFGEVYCNGLSHLQGTIFGTAIVFKLRLKSHSSEYDNHLLNSVIDGNKIPPGFCGLMFQDRRYSKSILQWL